MYAFISDEFATESLTQPSSHSKEQQLKLRDKLHGKFWSIEFIETWLARAIEISSKRVGSHVCQLSLLTILIIPYSLPKISTSKNPYTDTRDAELGTIPDAGALPMGCGVASGVSCFWGCWLVHRCRGMNALRTSVSSVKLLISLSRLTKSYPFTVFNQVSQKITILLYLYKWKNVQRNWDRCVLALYALYVRNGTTHPVKWAARSLGMVLGMMRSPIKISVRDD